MLNKLAGRGASQRPAIARVNRQSQSGSRAGLASASCQKGCIGLQSQGLGKSWIDSEGGAGSLQLIEPLLNALAKQGQIAGPSARPGLRGNLEALEAELLDGIFDPKRRGSLSGIVLEMQKLAMLVRDRTSNDMWRVLSQIDDRLATPAAGDRRMSAGTAAISRVPTAIKVVPAAKNSNTSSAA